MAKDLLDYLEKEEKSDDEPVESASDMKAMYLAMKYDSCHGEERAKTLVDLIRCLMESGKPEKKSDSKE